MTPLKNDFCFAVLSPAGMVDREATSRAGVFLHDTRHLSEYKWRLENVELLWQKSTANQLRQYFSRMYNHTQELLISRTFTLSCDGTSDVLVFENTGEHEINYPIDLQIDCDFVDDFESRGMVRKTKRPPVHLEQSEGHWVFEYTAVDEICSSTEISLAGAHNGQFITLIPGETKTITANATFKTNLKAASFAQNVIGTWRPKTPERELGFEEQKVFDQAAADIESLIVNTEQGRTIAAGIPNFVVPFGRDSIITAWLLLEADPALARSVLTYLAAKQGKKFDRYRDEEPGKIMHEHRESELSRIGELPFHTYYGTADATPLFVILLHDYVAKTQDVDFARSLETHWRSAISWIEDAFDNRGLVNFNQRSDGAGLTIQSWKDSQDSMSYGDGELATGALAVAEVQGYVYQALKCAAALSKLCSGSDAEQSNWTARAKTLAARFDELFWMPEHQNYALGLDAQGRQLDVNSSDSGHLLWTGIVPKSRAQILVKRLFEPDMWSGYGLRTLGANEKKYNALSYHNGSVWPHDTAIFGAGLERYGFKAELEDVREAIIALAMQSDDLRLPELVGGYARNDNTPPLPYIESCRPQAWSAAAAIYLINAA